MHIDGSCHCGAISFTAEVEPSRVSVCHCTDCQVLSGAPFRGIVMAPMEKFSLKGKPKSYIKVAQSGNRERRSSVRNAARRSIRRPQKTRRLSSSDWAA